MVWLDEATFQRYAASDYLRAFTGILSSGMLEKPVHVEKWRSPG
jgi:hypothetical protein